MNRVTAILAAALALLIILEALFARHHHPVFPWHYWPGFLAAVGVIACVVVVKVSKLLGKWGLQRGEEYDD